MTTILIILAIILYLIFKDKDFNSANKKYIILMTIILTVVSGLRHEGVGNDTFAYMQAYENNGTEKWSSLIENFMENFLNSSSTEKDPGYKILTKILYFFLPSGRLYLFAVALMYLIPFGIFIHKYSKNLQTSLFAYAFYLTLFWSYLPNSAIRQSITIGAILWGYVYLSDNKWSYYIILVLIGSLFHKSGLIVLSILPLYYFVNAKLFFKWTIVLFFLTLIFSNNLAGLFIDQSDMYNSYFASGYYNAANVNRPYMVILLFIGLYIITFIGLRKYIVENGRQKLLLLGTSLSMIFLPLIWVNPSLIRIIGYFAPFMGIMVGESFERINLGRLIRNIVIIMFIYHSLSSFNSFKMMWQDMELHERYSYQTGNNIIYIKSESQYMIKKNIA